MKRKILMGITTIFLLVLTGCGISIYTSYNWLKVNHFTYRTEKVQTDESVKMVVLSDLHDREFGNGNEKLVTKVIDQEPDVILLNGDFVNNSSDNTEIACMLIEKLAEIAPVYFAIGNHELEYLNQNLIKGSDLMSELEDAGAVVLDREYVDITIKGVELRLGGMYDYAFGLDGNDSAEAAPDEVRTFLEDFQNKDRLKIMMAHRPDSFIFGNAASYWAVDLVISGHTHGGQVVVPGLGGFYGGDQGWFPEYVHGMYNKDGMDIFITSGLGSYTEGLPRINNRPEIAVITLESQQ